MAKDSQKWMNQNQLAELFTTSIPYIRIHMTNILQDKELEKDSVIKDYLITTADRKEYHMKHYSLDMMLVIMYVLSFLSTQPEMANQIDLYKIGFTVNYR